LWRAEYGSQVGATPVPFELVWQKVLTAPDASSLTVFQHHERMGYCEFSTSVGQQMANVDDDNPPPAGLVARAGYKIHLAGNIALNNFTNRVKIDGRISFASLHQWSQVDLKISMRSALFEIHAFATNQLVHVKITSDGAVIERHLSVADLQNPGALIRAFTGNFAGNLLGEMDLPLPSPADTAQKIQWTAHRTRLKIGTETIPVYHLETTLLGNVISADISTVGEILDINLPGDISAHVDELIRNP
jgi:hypothetical protein